MNRCFSVLLEQWFSTFLLAGGTPNIKYKFGGTLTPSYFQKTLKKMQSLLIFPKNISESQDLSLMQSTSHFDFETPVLEELWSKDTSMTVTVKCTKSNPLTGQEASGGWIWHGGRT